MDKYANYETLARAEREGADYLVVVRHRLGAKAAVIAPHGGKIEPKTSEIARWIAGDSHSLYLFEGIKPDDNRDLHVTSHHFDEPRCLALISEHPIVIAVHGCAGSGQFVNVGGLDKAAGEVVARSLEAAQFEVRRDGHEFPGTEPGNICNRGASGRGIQLELSRGLRDGAQVDRFATAVRLALPGSAESTP